MRIALFSLLLISRIFSQQAPKDTAYSCGDLFQRCFNFAAVSAIKSLDTNSDEFLDMTFKTSGYFFNWLPFTSLVETNIRFGKGQNILANGLISIGPLLGPSSINDTGKKMGVAQKGISGILYYEQSLPLAGLSFTSIYPNGPLAASYTNIGYVWKWMDGHHQYVAISWGLHSPLIDYLKYLRIKGSVFIETYNGQSVTSNIFLEVPIGGFLYWERLAKTDNGHRFYHSSD